ncbi:MAG: hypothetical protein COA94_00435 [Rickettsiales bacterium]|nr:MAG: hypothetical protein COA94_00435 [Rickettsiales bacterium]
MFGTDVGVDMAIVIGFLILTLVVGFGQSGKIENIKEYALGGRNFSTGALIATVVASWVSGSGFSIVTTKTYYGGGYHLVATFGMMVSFLITAFYFVPRMGEFLGKTSIAEAMGELYGEKIRVIVAISGIIASSGYIAVQFKVFGDIVGYFSNSDRTLSIIITGLAVTAYSAYGGVRSVTFTDILQFFTFCFAIPLIGIMIWNKLYMVDSFNMMTALEVDKFNYKKILDVGNPQFWEIIPLMIYFALPGMKPSIFQRISMGTNLAQIKKVFVVSAFLIILVQIATAWIAFLVFSANPNIEQGELFGYIVDNYTYTGLKGLFIVCVIAMTMSTADTEINISSVLFSNDACAALNITPKSRLLLSKIFSLFLGICSIFVALSTQDLLQIILSTASFYMPVVSVLFILTIAGFRTSPKSALIGMSAGFFTVIIWRLAKIEMNPIAVAMFVNLVFLMGSHYLLDQKGGWVGIKDKSFLEAQKLESIQKRQQFFESIKNFNLVDFYKKHAASDNLTYVGFGIYCAIYTITTMHSTEVNLLQDNGQIILAIYQIMMVTGIVMAMYPLWPLNITNNIKERIIQTWWPIAIFYMMIFFSTFFVLVNGANHLQPVVFAINMIIAILILGWKTASVFIVGGVYLAVQFYKYYMGIDYVDISIGSPQFILMYSLVLIGTILIIFLKPKQEHLEKTEHQVGSLAGEVGSLTTEVNTLDTKVVGLNEKVVHYSARATDNAREVERLGATSQKILNNVSHELRLPVGNVINFASMMHDGLEKFSKEQLKTISKEVYQNSNRLSTMILNMLDLATLDVKKIELMKRKVNFSKLVEERVESCRNIYVDSKPLKFKINIEPGVIAPIDRNYIRQTIDNLVINAITFSETGQITISVAKQANFVTFTVQDQGIGIPASEIYDVFTPFKMASNTETKAEGRGVGLALCKAAVEAHGGKIKVESHGVGVLFRVVLPLNSE